MPVAQVMKNTAHIRYTDRQMFIITPYDAAFVEALKSTLKSRKWLPAKKEWAIDIREGATALELVGRFYEVVQDNEMPDIPQVTVPSVKASSPIPFQNDITPEWLAGGNLEIWTDGACISNPGPGGYGIIFSRNGQKKAKSGGFRLTTNNRMEIMAAIVALETLKEKSRVTIHSDSQYLVQAVMKGWAKKWQGNNWMRNKKDKAINPDLWERLLNLCERHTIEFLWVKGHDSQTENEWCDQLAVQAARQPDLPIDAGYELLDRDSGASPTPIPQSHLL
jgi:ribonuclease HI